MKSMSQLFPTMEVKYDPDPYYSGEALGKRGLLQIRGDQNVNCASLWVPFLDESTMESSWVLMQVFLKATIPDWQGSGAWLEKAALVIPDRIQAGSLEETETFHYKGRIVFLKFSKLIQSFFLSVRGESGVYVNQADGGKHSPPSSINSNEQKSSARRIHFTKGATVTELNGEAPTKYVLWLLKDQLVRIRLTVTGGNASLTVLQSDGSLLAGQSQDTEWMGSIRRSGDYYVSISTAPGETATFHLEITAR